MWYDRDTSRKDNLGVGRFDLPERAFSASASGSSFRLSEGGVIGKRLFNEVRLQYRWGVNSIEPVSEKPTVLVLDAFNSGGSQNRSRKRFAELEVADNFDFALGHHAMRAGILFKSGKYLNETSINTNGTFTFSSIDNFVAGRPSSYTKRIGSGSTDFSQYQFGGYLQDDLRARENLTLSAGLRYEAQNNLRDHNNFSPRLGFAWSPFKDGRTTVRGGAGIFYDWFTPETVGEILALDGQRQHDLVVLNPDYANPFDPNSGTLLPLGVLRQDGSLRNPYIGKISLSAQRQLGRLLSLRATYVHERGVHLFRSRKLNPTTSVAGQEDNLSGNITQVESSGNSSKDSLNIDFTGNLGKRTYLFANYTLAKTVNDTDGPFALPQDSFNLRLERGPASDDVRHRLYVNVGWKAIKGLRLSTTFVANSALPYNVITGHDDNGDAVFNDRPVGIGRNSNRGSAQWDVNARASWTFAFGSKAHENSGPGMVVVDAADVGAASSGSDANKRWKVMLYLSVLNLCNHADLINFSGVQTSPYFGKPTAALPGRRFETGLRFTF